MFTTFDTKQAYEAFSQHGFSVEQAEVLTEYLQKMQVASVENLATKSDLKLLSTELRAEMLESRSEMTSLESRLTIKIGGIMAVGIGVLAALISVLAIV